MKNFTTKHVRNLLILGLSTTLFFASCKKTDVVPGPTVDIKEIGNDKKTAYAGADLHLDAEIVAVGVVDNIKVQITPAATGTGWTFTKTYTEGFAGKKNADFHVHIDIPEGTKAGDYKLVLVATDKNGKSTTKSDNFKIEAADPSIPSIADSKLAISADKTQLTLTGTVNAPNKIAKIEAEIKSKWPKLFTISDAAMVGKTTYALNSALDISAAPAGHYHIFVKVTDQAGKFKEIEMHFDK